jgi:putative SOS response-associated peptidase YedK
MCGRFALWTPPGTITRYFKVNVTLDIQPRYNIAPGQNVLAFLQSEDTGWRPAMFRWGLIPGWAKEESIGYKMINARAESIQEKPAFKSAFKYRRCLIPATGFYEWKQEGAGKQPYLIRFNDTDLFAIAGIWEAWKKPASEEVIQSCAILTTSANSVVAPIHDRMPVIIHPDDLDLWLDTRASDFKLLDALMRPFDEGDMACHRVSKMINRVKNDHISLIQPQEE